MPGCINIIRKNYAFKKTWFIIWMHYFKKVSNNFFFVKKKFTKSAGWMFCIDSVARAWFCRVCESRSRMRAIGVLPPPSPLGLPLTNETGQTVGCCSLQRSIPQGHLQRMGPLQLVGWRSPQQSAPHHPQVPLRRMEPLQMPPPPLLRMA